MIIFGVLYYVVRRVFFKDDNEEGIDHTLSMTSINENLENIQNYSMNSNETELYDGDSEYFADIVNSINTPSPVLDATTTISDEYDDSYDIYDDDFNQSTFSEPCGINPASGLPMMDEYVDVAGNVFGTDSDHH